MRCWNTIEVGRKCDQNVTVKSLTAAETSSSEVSGHIGQCGVPILSHISWCLEAGSAEQFSFFGQICIETSWKRRKKSRGGSSSGSSPQCFSLVHHALPLPTWPSYAVPLACCLSPTAFKFSLHLPSLRMASLVKFTLFPLTTQHPQALLDCMIHAHPFAQALLPTTLVNWWPPSLMVQHAAGHLKA